MKISITFRPEEEQLAETLLGVVWRFFGFRAKIKRTPQRDGYGHTYITTPMPEKH